MPQNSVMRARASGGSIKVLESPIGLITQKRSDEKKNHIKKWLTHSRAHCQNLTRAVGVEWAAKNSISARFLLMGLVLAEAT